MRPGLSALVILLTVPLTLFAAGDKKEPTYRGKPLGQWVKKLRSPNLDERRDAAIALEESVGPEGKAAVPALDQALGDPDSLVRSRAAGALKRIGPKAAPAVGALIDCLRDRDFVVRVNSAQALGAIGPAARPAVPALIKALEDKDFSVRAGAAEGLAGIGPGAAPAVPALAKLLRSRKGGLLVLPAVMHALSRVGKPGAGALAEVLTGGDQTGRALAAEYLAKMGRDAEPAVGALVRLLKSKDARDRVSAASTLGHVGPAARPARAALRDALKDGTGEVRQAAAGALWRIDPDGSRRAGVPRPLTRYTAFIQPDRRTFDKEELAIGGEEVGGTLVLWVNGDPVDFYSGGGKMLDLNLWLRPGRNELTFSGKHRKPVYVLVAPRRGTEYRAVVGKKAFPGPGSPARAEALVFRAGDAPRLPEPDALSERPRDRARYEKEVGALLAEVRGLIAAHNGREAARLLTAGPRLWAEAAYGATPKEVQDELDQLAKVLSDPKVQPVDPDRPVRLLFGKRLVLAHAGLPEKGKEPGHVLAVEKNRKRAGLRQLQLARVGGKWVIWYTPQAIVVSLSAK